MPQPFGVLKFGAGLALALAAAPAAADSGGGDNGAYYSPLRQIDDHNVVQLGFAWEYRTGTTRALEATPVVVGKTLYTSGNGGVVYALNAASGEQLWTFDPHNDGQTARNTCCDVVNRGVVVRDGRVFVASNDGRLFALEATTGKVIWSANTFAAGEARSSTGAPQLAGPLVLIGNSGTDLGSRGVRGYVTAYEIASGRLRWRFYAVPTRDESNPSVEMQRALRTWDPKATPSGGAVWAGTSEYRPNRGSSTGRWCDTTSRVAQGSPCRTPAGSAYLGG
jgi:quinohemoprotein ethanol dehydrogenase